MDKLSYALGLSMAGNFVASGIRDLNVDDFADGLRTVFGNAEKKMSFDEAKQIVTQYFTELEQRGAQANEQAGRDFLEKNKNAEGVHVTASGLQYLVVKEGTGRKPTATSQVKCHYEGTFPNGQVFDSSYKRGEPAVFGLNQVIKGWTEGLQLMAEGAKYELYLPYNLAYGEQGAGGAIPPYSALKFVVELIEVL